MYTAVPRPFALPVVERRKTVSDNGSLSEVHAAVDRVSFIAQLYQEVFFGIEQSATVVLRGRARALLTH